MPRLPALHSYIKALREQGRRGILVDDSSLDVLLGFEKDKVESRPVKTFIRRLWLAFQSSKHSSMPRCFLDPVTQTFSEEVEALVSEFVRDEDRLALEIAKDPLVVDEKTKEFRSAFLEDTARTLLVTREWGDYLWGSRTFCRVPLCNAKPEMGYDKPPEWPRDQDFIIQTVRYWLAARLQYKLRNPKQGKKIPRVECPEDPDQERASLAAVFPGTKLYGSEEEAAHPVVQESVDVTKEAHQSRHHEEYALRRMSTRKRKPSARAVDIGGLPSTCTDTIVTDPQCVSRAGQQQRVRAGHFGIPSPPHPEISAALSRAPDEQSNDVRSNSLKKSRGSKRRRTASIDGKQPAQLLPTPELSIGTLQLPSPCPCGTCDGPKLASAPNPRTRGQSKRQQQPMRAYSLRSQA